MVNKIFKNQLGRIMEGYVDNMLVKSMNFQQYLLDLEEVFYMLNHHQIKLNPSKCVFAIEGRKFLGFLVSSNGIKPNLKKGSSHIKHDFYSVSKWSSTSYREIGCSQSVYNLSGERTLPFFKTLRNITNFKWTLDF